MALDGFAAPVTPWAVDWPRVISEVFSEIEPRLGEGRVADYIPALARADPRAFGLSVVLVDGTRHDIGDSSKRFSIQSISKVFALALALRLEGDALWRRVGREPSGTPFNSIVQLEREQGIPRNPFINAGAMVVTDTILSHVGPDRGIGEILDFVRRASGVDDIGANDAVAASEREWGDRNRSLAYFMRSFGVIKSEADRVLDTYFGQCSIEMSTAELARAGLFLACEGRDPITGEVLANHTRVNRINALMLTCGHYDMSGDFAFRVGLPGKSGVGGGILAIVPDIASIAVWSPALNAAGNSLAGTQALELLSHETGVNLF